MDNNQVAIFVCSPNSYSDVLKIFIECKEKYWSDCPYDFVLATNNQHYDNIVVHNNNKDKDGWTERALPVLKSIHYKYIILLCDDAFISKKIENKIIDEIIDTMEKEKLKYCRLKRYRHGKRVESSRVLSYLHKKTAYGLNLYKGIFLREYLVSLIGDGEKTCWQMEMDWNHEAANSPNEYYDDLVACTKEVIPTIHGLEKGRWFPSAKKKLKRKGIDSFEERDQMSKMEEVVYQVKTTLGDLVSPKIRSSMKTILQQLGIHFTTDK